MPDHRRYLSPHGAGWIVRRPAQPRGKPPALGPTAPYAEMTTEQHRRLVGDRLTEEAFQAQIIAAARDLGWLVYHARQVATCICCASRHCEYCAPRRYRTIAKGSDPGWPDLVLGYLNPPRLIVAEVKRQSGTATAQQVVWLQLLAAIESLTFGVVKGRLWRPTEWTEIVDLLKEPRAA